MIISHTYRFIFFSAPKTGSESVRLLLEPYNEELVRPWRHTQRSVPFYPHMPPRIVQDILSARGQRIEDYRTITCIRDPYARLVSLYRMIHDVDGLWRMRRRMGLPVPGFRDWLAATRPEGRGGGGRRHQRWRRYGAWSARAWCSDVVGQFLVTDLIPTSDIAHVLPRVLAECGVRDLPELPHVNARPATNPATWYDTVSARNVARDYAWDLRYLSQFQGIQPTAVKAG